MASKYGVGLGGLFFEVCPKKSVLSFFSEALIFWMATMSKSSGKTTSNDVVLCAMPEAYLTRIRFCLRDYQDMLLKYGDRPMSHDVFMMCGGKPPKNPDGTFNKKKKYSSYAMSVAADDGVEIICNHPTKEEDRIKAKKLMGICDKKYAQQPIDVSKLKLEYVDPSDKTAATAAATAPAVGKSTVSDAVASPIARAAGPSDGTTTSDKSSSSKKRAMDAIFGSASASREVHKMSPKKKMVKKLHIDNSGDNAADAMKPAEEEKEVEEAEADDDEAEAEEEAEEGGEAEAGQQEAGQQEAGEEETEEEEDEEEDEEDDEEEGEGDEDDEDDEDYQEAEDGEEEDDEEDDEDDEAAEKA